MVFTYVVLSPPCLSLWDASHELKFDHSELTLKRPQVNVMSRSKKDLLLHMNGSVLLSWTMNTFQVLSSLYSVSNKSCCRKRVRDLWWPNDWPFESPLVISCTLSLKWAEVPWLQKYLAFLAYSFKAEGIVLFPISYHDWWGHTPIWPDFASQM